MVAIKIDNEFKDKIPAMPEDAFLGLRDDILRDGYVRDPLVVWKEENILLDGHHRWRVIQEFPEKFADKFKIDYKSFPDRWACVDWICANQLHKHNMTKEQREELIGQMYKARKRSVGAPSANKNAEKKQCVQNENVVSKRTPRTNEIIGKELGINPSTVTRAEKFADGVEIIKNISPKAAEKILAGKADISRGDVRKVKELDKETQVKVAKAIENGETAKIDIDGSLESDTPTPKKEQPTHNTNAVKEQRELTGEIYAQMSDSNRESTFNIDDLVEEIQINGSNYIRSLRNTLAIRTSLLSDAEAKKRVTDEINKIIDKVKELEALINERQD